MTDTGRVVLVTGASSGIGLATALELAGRGDRLALLARSPESLERARVACEQAGAAGVTVHPADVTDRPAVQRCVADVLHRHGRIDVAVHSAGVVAYGTLQEVPPEVYEQVVTTNVLGSATVAREVLAAMRERGAGTLYLVGSVIGAITVPEMSAYVVSKWAVRALARQLQVEHRGHPGVRVCLVRPGGVDTPIYAQAANFTGRLGKAPPPVYRPQTVARRIADSFDDPPRQLDVGVANPLMALGFTVLPAVYDRLVGPLFTLLCRGGRIPATEGNVLAPNPDGDRLTGRR